jgi:hypothetical protein
MDVAGSAVMASEYWKEKQLKPGQSMCAWALVAALLLGFQVAHLVWGETSGPQHIQTADISIR